MKPMTRWDDILMSYVATDADNYCGCPDCQDPIGYGETKQDAIDDLIDQYEVLNARR